MKIKKITVKRFMPKCSNDLIKNFSYSHKKKIHRSRYIQFMIFANHTQGSKWIVQHVH